MFMVTRESLFGLERALLSALHRGDARAGALLVRVRRVIQADLVLARRMRQYAMRLDVDLVEEPDF
jgi:hypothetical protein